MNVRTALRLAKLAASFDRKAAKLRKAIPPALEAAATDLAAEMQRLAPHRTGELAASIVVTAAGDSTPPDENGATRKMPMNRVAVTAGNAEVTYAKATEFGTSREHAEPFFVPAIRAKREAIKAGVVAAVRETMGGKL